MDSVDRQYKNKDVMLKCPDSRGLSNNSKLHQTPSKLKIFKNFNFEVCM